jgi:ABC-type bacteriocin/lantibiotic exporter with double-glycine peptidase domain
MLAAGASRHARAGVSVPWIAQRSATDCGRAVLASLLAWRHGGSPAAQYDRIPDPADRSRGYSIAEMRRLGGRFGVSLGVIAPRTVVIAGQCTSNPAIAAYFANLAQIAARHPVVVPVSSFAVGHYLVLTGAGGGAFTVLDPASGMRTMSAAALQASMCGFGYVALEAR